jgi:hypothetical protein
MDDINERLDNIRAGFARFAQLNSELLGVTQRLLAAFAQLEAAIRLHGSPAEMAAHAPSTTPPVDEPDDRVVLRYLRGLVGHDGAATLPMISDGTNLSLVRTSDALDYLLSRTLARSFVNGNARFFAPTKWSDDDKRHLDPPEGNEIAAVVQSTKTPSVQPFTPGCACLGSDANGHDANDEDACACPCHDGPGQASKAPGVRIEFTDGETFPQGLHAGDLHMPADSKRRKESPRTCVEWASDDASWKAYVASCAKAADDHPAKPYAPFELEQKRHDFRNDEKVIADNARYPRPGAKFTRWLETRP